VPKSLSTLMWVAIAAAGAGAFAFIALARGETISAAWLVVAAVCSYLVAYPIGSRSYDHDRRRSGAA
jgi:carbon starvation protein